MTGEAPVCGSDPKARRDRLNAACSRRSQVYTADLDSSLHYLLRVELAAHGMLEGAELKVFKDFVTLVAKVTAESRTSIRLEVATCWDFCSVSMTTDRLSPGCVLCTLMLIANNGANF